MPGHGEPPKGAWRGGFRAACGYPLRTKIESARLSCIETLIPSVPYQPMTGSAQTRGLRKWSSEVMPDVRRLYAACPAKNYGISEAQFAQILDEVTNKYL